MLISLRYLIADYERHNFSISQCSWDLGAQENIVAIESPSNLKANATSVTGTNTTALKPGRVAAVVIGSTASLLFIFFVALVCKRKIIARFKARAVGKPELNEKDILFLHEDKTSNARTPGTEHRSEKVHEIDGHLCLGIELPANKVLREMNSNEEVGHELAGSNPQISELPS